MALQRTDYRETPVGPPVRPRGILANAAPAPDGWEAGGIHTTRNCSNVELQDQCVTFTPEQADERGGKRPGTDKWPTFVITSSSECSTMSGLDQSQMARDTLETVTDYALGRALADADFNTDAPSLADATDLGEFPSAKVALAKLETAAGKIGEGQLHVVHATPAAAIYLAAENLLSDSGQTPSGAQLIISAGYEQSDESIRIWATGRVWAAIGDIKTVEAVNRRMNDREAFADRNAVVGFNSCINVTASIAE